MDFSNFLRGGVVLLWLVVVGLIVLAVVRASRGQKANAVTTSIIVVAVLAVLLTTVSAGLVFVPPEERGVVVSALQPNGVRPDALQPGLRWIIPYFENVVSYPIYRQTYTMSIAAGEGQIQGDDSVTARTSDGQEVFMDASVIYAVDPKEVVQVHIDWQSRYVIELVRPLARGIIRDAVSQFGIEEVYSTRRSDLTQQIREEMARKLDENGLILVEFILRNITFSPEYAASVEQKQIAEQQAQQAFFVVEQRRQEAEQARQVAQGKADAAVIEAQGAADGRIIQAQAEAEALQKISEVLAQNEQLLSYRYIEKLTPGIQVMLLPSDNPFLLPLPTLESPITGGPSSSPTAVPAPLPTPEPTATP
jgi:regulator of protease activity HflC (stomatin/prohibitin superfamily)